MDSELTLQREKAAAEHGHPVSLPCEKCMGMDYIGMEMPAPLGGATSFSELQAYRKAQNVEMSYLTAVFDYQDLERNILNDNDLTTQEKAAALVGLTTDFQNVVNNIEQYYPSAKTKEDKPSNPLVAAVQLVKSFLKGNPDKTDDMLKEFDLSPEAPAKFKMFETPDGPRWLAVSTNSFKDREDEIFAHKALEECIEYHDKTGERGPLRVFHVAGADIGDCDFQGMAGRFVIESGKFRDDELGQKAVEYFRANSDKEFQVSIGFTYKVGDESDGVYDWLRIRERSVCPYGTAANPFTSFAFGELGGEHMDERKVKMLGEMFGETVASGLIARAETHTKELEESVAFKTKEGSDLLTELEAFSAHLPEESRKEYSEHIEALKAKMPPGKKPAEDAADGGADDDQEDATGKKKPPFAKGKELGALPEDFLDKMIGIADRLEQVADLKNKIEDLETQVKELSQGDGSRGRTTFRASEDDKNTLDPDKIKAIVGDDTDKAPVNHARQYVEDLGLLAGASRS